MTTNDDAPFEFKIKQHADNVSEFIITRKGCSVLSKRDVFYFMLCIPLYAFLNRYHTINPLIGLVTAFAIWLTSKVYTIKEESLLVIKDLGLELKTTYLLFNKQESKFIDQSKILEIIINEGISRWQVKFYLAVIVDGGSVAVVFENLLPRLDVLKEVYNGTRKMMYNK
ncbi:hypothetical protein MP638_003002 [Amoeboaphelidium occidentale]|nr:hypothetical protein MP638_003002 [Amoeboaphelidium occidentale]